MEKIFGSYFRCLRKGKQTQIICGVSITGYLMVLLSLAAFNYFGGCPEQELPEEQVRRPSYQIEIPHDIEDEINEKIEEALKRVHQRQ